jgi:tetratricopeptide (TPR) repeat protein
VHVTIIPPSAEDVLSHLRAQVDDLAHELVADAAADQSALLKQRIFLLHRTVEQHAQVIDSLQRDVRALIDGWKGRFAGTGSVTPPAARTVAAPAAPATPATSAGAPDTTVPAAHPGHPRVIDELNASTFVERGWSRIATGDYVGAEEALDKALALNPGDANAETLLGWAQMGQGKLDAAKAVFDQVLERVPNHALALINIGFVQYKRGNDDLAIEHLTTAIAFDSDRKAMLYAHYYLGLVRFDQERYAEASGALLRAIELGPNMIEARFELGRVYWFSGRTDDAIATWRTGATLNKFNPWSARCQDMLSTIADGGAPSRVS